jgi:Ni/Fe-hydrogenase 1 B-type cytochrome subunit
MGRVRQLHFLAAYVFLAAFLLRTYWFFAGNNYARSGFPLVWRAEWWKSVFRQVTWYLGTKRGRVDLGHNSLAGLSYAVFIYGGGIFMMLSGFALYGETNPGGFWDRTCGWVIPLLGGSFRTHVWHHTAAWAFVIFLIIHVYIVIYDSIMYRNGLVGSMVSGDKFYEEGDIDSDEWVS